MVTQKEGSKGPSVDNASDRIRNYLGGYLVKRIKNSEGRECD